jgi:TPR repeat protein
MNTHIRRFCLTSNDKSLDPRRVPIGMIIFLQSRLMNNRQLSNRIKIRIRNSIYQRVISKIFCKTFTGQHWLAERLQFEGKCLQAVEILEKLIQKNHTQSMAALAHILMDGREHIKQDHNRMFELLAIGLSKSCHECKGVKASFHMYRDWDPKSIPRDQCYKLAKSSAKRKSKFGMQALGMYYLYSTDGNRDIAIEYLNKAARLGECNAMYQLGMMHRWGNSLPQDTSQSAIWYELAAAQGFPGTLDLIAQMYKDGVGVPCDIDKAIYWYKRAVAANCRDATLFLDRAINKKIKLE